MTIIFTLIGILASILGIFEYMITIREKINRAIDSLRLPKELDFYFLSFFALIAASLGGLFWNWVCGFFGSDCPYVGGTQSEPHGILSIIWPITTLSMVVATLIILNSKFHLMKVREQLLLYFTFLIGITIGSVMFYDLPLSGNSGFRNYFDAINIPYHYKELYLVLIWASLLSACGFLAMGLMKLKIAPKPVDVHEIVFRFIEQIGLGVGLTTFAVLFCILTFPPDSPRFDTARGIIAGLSLRMSLFFGLIVAHVPLEGVLPPYARHILRVKSYIGRRKRISRR
jgi:hypothetical protein